jgi:hypothetical protein
MMKQKIEITKHTKITKQTKKTDPAEARALNLCLPFLSPITFPRVSLFSCVS